MTRDQLLIEIDWPVEWEQDDRLAALRNIVRDTRELVVQKVEESGGDFEMSVGTELPFDLEEHPHTH